MNKMITRYEIREFGHKGSCHSRTILGGRLVERNRAQKIVRFLKRRGRDVVIAPVKVGA